MIAERRPVLDPEHRAMEIADLRKEKAARRRVAIAGGENLGESGGGGNGARESVVGAEIRGIRRFIV